MEEPKRFDWPRRGFYEGIIFRILESEGGLNADSMMAYLGRSPFLDAEILAFVKVGIERYFSGDHVSGLHVLVPKLEEALRRTVGRLGSPTISRDSASGGMRERPLDDILSDPALEELIGSRRRFYLEHVLTSEQGDNLRNDVAHGLMTMERCTKELVQMVLHLYLMLTPFVAEAG